MIDLASVGVSLLLAATPPGLARPADADQQVRGFMAAHETALKAGHLPRLEKAYTSDLRFVLESGAVADRSALMERFRRDRQRAPAVSFSAERVLRVRDFVRVTGMYTLSEPGKRLVATNSYVAYLRPRGSSWVIISLQFLASPVPASR